MTRASLIRLARPVWAAGLPGASKVLPDFRNAVPDLYIAPLLIGSRETAHDLYRGEFAFAGSTVVSRASGIFTEMPPSPAWHRALHSFGWVNDLMASGSELHRAYARALMQAWHAAQVKAPPSPVRDLIAASRRLTIVALHWPELLRGASMAFHQDLARMASRDTSLLLGAMPKQPGSRDGLMAALALARMALSFRNFDGIKSFALSRLASELDRFVLPDGGPVTRNAEHLIDLLLDLVPLREAMAAGRREVPHPIHAAIERAMPMLRFFMHGDGGLTVFQGVTAARTRAIRVLLEHDTVYGRPHVHAHHSGFARIQHGWSHVVTDGKAGPAAMAPLAFEFSDDAQRIVVNCGFPPNENAAWSAACTGPAAHSTATLMAGNRSSGEHLRKFIGWLRRKPAPPPAVRLDAVTTPEGSVIHGDSDMFRAEHQIRHQRSVYLSASGLDLRGEDRFLPTGPLPREDAAMPFTLRFHLHPAVRAALAEDGETFTLTLPTNATWQFVQRGGIASVEESIFLAGEGGPRPAQQIVIRGGQARGALVNWAFKAATRTLLPSEASD